MGNKNSTADSSKLSTLTTLTKNNKRWCVFGIALNHVLVPSIRPLLEQEILQEYNDLKLNHGIDVQTKHSFPVPKYPTQNAMKYENINANDTKLKPPHYKMFDYTKFDYKVTSHVDFGKLFLQNHMAKFNAFNETCDASAVLNLLGRIPVFSAALQNAADVVREGRNAWGHCDFTDWNEANFKKRFDDMKKLVTGVGLLTVDESKVLADLNDWEAKGVRLCMNTDVDSELVKDVLDHVSTLLSDVWSMAFESKEQMNNVMGMLNNIQVDLKEIEERLQEIEHKQDTLQRGQNKLQCEQDNLQREHDNLKLKQDDIQREQDVLNKRVTNVEQKDQCNCPPHVNLTKCNFKGDIQNRYESIHPGTREWLSKKVDRWYKSKDSNSQVMILTADAGFGKSTFAAKVCKEYQKTGQLKACHFFNSRCSDYSDPCKMLESLASQLCENVNGFKEILASQLQRDHSRTTTADAFRVFLKDPLNLLPEVIPNILIVIDGLDESVSDEKKHLLDVIEEEFRMLPKWVKIFITSRPELVTKEKLERVNHVDILGDDKENHEDLESYLVSCVKGRYAVNTHTVKAMVRKCEGSFLYAYYFQLELRKLNNADNVLSVVPKGIHSIYQKYFKRMEEELKKVSTDIDFDRILEILVAMRGPFPLSLIAKILKLPGSTRTMREVINKVNECLSALLPVYDDCVTVFHKTVVDWLTADGKYGNHLFSVSWLGANKTLWQACRQTFEQLEVSEPKEREKQAEKYALKNGISHLNAITFFSPFRFSLIRDRVPDHVMHLKRDKKFFGCGWLVFKNNENVYVMTTNSVLRLIECDRVDNALEIQVFHREGELANYDATVIKNDFVVVSSNEDSALDYAVLRLKTSNIVEELPLQVSRTSPEPGDEVFAPDDALSEVLPYPEDLVDWAKNSRSSSSRNIPTPSCEPSINFHDAEDLKGILISYCRVVSSLTPISFEVGLPIFKLRRSYEVVAMSSCQVFINREKEKEYFITFCISMSKIIDDIGRKKRDEAKKWFPNYFD